MEINDLISKTAAIKWFFRPYSNEEYYSNFDVEKALKAIPAINAVPVIHGRWIKYKPDMHGTEPLACNVCNYLFAQLYPRNYCPNCGAKMDGERRNDE